MDPFWRENGSRDPRSDPKSDASLVVYPIPKGRQLGMHCCDSEWSFSENEYHGSDNYVWIGPKLKENGIQFGLS